MAMQLIVSYLNFSANLTACKAACGDDCQCRSIQHRGTECFLKTKACTDNELKSYNHTNDYVRMGSEYGRVYSFCHRPTKDCTGRDIKKIVANLATCVKVCQLKCRCRSVQHRGMECWLKDYKCEDNELNTHEYLNDYYKIEIGAGETCPDVVFANPV